MAPEAHLNIDNESLGLTHQKQLALLQSWEFDGRIAIKGGEQNGSASLLWKQSKSKFDLRLLGPLGRQMVHAKGDDAGAIVDLPKQKNLYVKNIGELIGQNAGWEVPVERFRYWVKGAFAPGEIVSYQLDVYGHLKELRQDGWVITYNRYSRVGHIDLPGKIFLSREPYRVRMVVNHWEIHE